LIKRPVVRRIIIPTAAIIVCLASALPCLAASFSGVVTLTTPAGARTIKLYIKGDQMSRQETNMPMKTINILRIDKKTILTISPETKQYMETPMRSAPPKWNSPTVEQALARVATKKALGKETVNGYQCVKYEYTFKDMRRGVMTQWVSPKLDYPIKQVTKVGMQSISMEIKNIKEGNIPMSMFEAPKGYKKVAPPRPPAAGMPKPRK
jgi:hypothetical protein